ncbi:MAG: hypothetical protein K2Q21_05145 [Chitinophagaceae bacterium]|nr:hypothetical protein [Chitinophagaceae bacterium]
MKYMLLVASVLFSFFAIAQTPIKVGCLSGNCENGIGKYRFKNLGIYEGHWKNALPDGEGTMLYADGSLYSGDWKNGKRSGTGEAKDKSGNIDYAGQWIDDTMLHPELSATYKEEKLKLYADVFKSIYEGFQQLKIVNQKGACSLEINFNLEGKDYKMHGFAIVTLKVDGKDYTKKALIEGTIDPLTNTINAKETLYLSKDELPSQLKWNQATYQLTIYTDSDHAGHYLLKGVSKDEDAFITELKEKNLPK